MRINIKLTIIIIIFSILLVGSVGLYFGFYLKNYHKRQSIENFKTISRISTESYFTLEKSLKIRTIDWSSDGFIRSTVKKILDAQAQGDEQRQKTLSEELGTYIKDKKMVYDPAVVIVDILDRNGIVIVSSRKDRIGVDEKEEEQKFGAIRFQEAMTSTVPEVFIKSVVYEDDEHTEPMVHLTARIFSADEKKAGNQPPLDAVFLVHYVNQRGLNNLFFLGYSDNARADNQSFLLGYKTAEVYLVNQDYLMVSSSRFVADAVLKQRVDTEPVKSCFEEGRDITGGYTNYLGKEVLGSSVCLKDSGLVLITEGQSEEIFHSVTEGIRYLILVGVILLFISAFSVILIVKHNVLRGIYVLTAAAREVGRGNLRKRISVKSNDEIGMLSETFNYMADSLEKSNEEIKRTQKHLQDTNKKLEQKNEELEKFNEVAVGREFRMIELKKRIKELEESDKPKKNISKV